MAEYQPLASQSLATSTMESHDSRELSDDDLVDVESFASFRGYTPREIENLLVTFNGTRSLYRLDGDIEAHFYAVTSSFQMKPDDVVGICPMRKSVPFVSTHISECAAESDPQAVTDEIYDESEIVAKKALFKIDQLPAELASEYYFQFCYLNSKNEVIGVSTPFRFQKDDSKDSTQVNYPTAQLSQVASQMEGLGENYDSMVMEKRDDDDFIVVRSQESFLKERIEHLNKSNTLLEYLIRSLEKDLSNKNVELQKMSSKLDGEKSISGKLEEEKQQALAQFEDISRKYSQLQMAMSELKQLIEKEQNCNEQLQAELNTSKSKISNLENTFHNIQIDEVELKNILKDKEEEIAMHKDMVANFQQINDDLNRKLNITEDKMLNLQSSLASALNELRIVSQEKEKIHDYEQLIGENKALNQRVFDLETVKENQTREIKSLEDELRTSVANLTNLDTKLVALQSERNSNAAKEQKSALALDKTKFELIEMHARLEQSRVEYANLYRKYRSLQKDRPKIERATTSASRSNSIISNASSPSTSHIASLSERVKDKMDDIDLKLQQLEKEEDVQMQQAAEVLVRSMAKLSAGGDGAEKHPKESLLIDIDSEQHHDSSPIVANTTTSTQVPQVEGHTVVKTIVPAGAESSAAKEKTLVPIPCIMCDQVIECRQHEDGSGQMHEMVNHLEVVHKQKMCPVCSTLFDTRLPIFATYFANHIQNHFNNIKYPSLNPN